MKNKTYKGIALGLLMIVGGAMAVPTVTNGNVSETGTVRENVRYIPEGQADEDSARDIVAEKRALPVTARALAADSGKIEETKAVSMDMSAITESAIEEKSSDKEAAEGKNASEDLGLVIADVTNYVNIRDQAGEQGEIVGKLYDDSVGRILETEGEWYKIESGCVSGYVKAEFVLTGNEAKEKADKVGIRMAKVTTTTLKVRMEPSLEAKVLGLVPEGDLLTVSEEVDGFVKVSVEEGEGYVSVDYVEVYTENVVAESIKDEQERLAREAEERKRAEEAARKAIGKNKEKREETQSGVPENTQAESISVPSNSALGQKIVDYAVQFVGNPYVYGGTSLTNGADCSGFVMSVYANFGISLPRTSGEQGKRGSSIASLAEAAPGDLIWYSGHIGIYMGNNQLVHASNRKDGIKISDVNYRPILGIRRIV